MEDATGIRFIAWRVDQVENEGNNASKVKQLARCEKSGEIGSAESSGRTDPRRKSRA